MAPTEKKRVNLVNLKTQYGIFLNKYFTCQNCFQIDCLAIGFNCEHKFCLKCNDNQTDNCKECKENIENLKDDSLSNNLLPHFQELKDIMNVDLKKVASKYKNQQLSGDQQLNDKQNNREQLNEQELNNQQQLNNQPQSNNQLNNQEEEEVNNQHNKEAEEEKDEDKQQKEDNNESEEETNSTTKKSNKSRKSTKKTNETKKNNQPVNDEQANKTTRSTRESNRSKEKTSLKDIIKESTEKPAAAAAVAEKTISKSTRKADKSTKTMKNSQEIVIISTSISDNEIKILNRFAKKFNARVVSEFTPEITHLVTLENKPNLTTRTLKYLKSLLTHKWLLNFKWIADSLANGELVDEVDYELLGITKQIEANLGAPKRSRENPIELFKGKKFLVDGKFKQGLPKKDYEDLITIGGGELIDECDLDDDTYIIIEQNYKSKFKSRKNTLFTNDFLNYVSDFKFDL